VSRRSPWTAPVTACAVAALALAAHAHHIMGIPHYSYDEAYPQAPVITYAIEAGPYVVNLTGYPGRPAPHELAEVHAYVRRASDDSDVFSGPINARVERDGLFGPQVVWGPVETRFEENLHKLAPTFGEAGNYRVRLEMMLEGQPYELDFPMVVGEPTSPTTTLLAFGGGLLALLVVARAAKIKLDRRRAAARGAGC
jgi:hypothetical protein